jgi:membrane fusion protein (multidrug efflux system)
MRRRPQSAAGVNVPITSVNTSSQVSSTEADVNSARAGIQVAKQQFEAAKAQLQSGRSQQCEGAERSGRYKQLVDKQEISQQQYDQATAAAGQRRRRRSRARQRRRGAAAGDAGARKACAGAGQLAVRQYAPKQMQIIKAKAASALADGAAQESRSRPGALNLQYTKIVAPVNGIVSNRTVEVGQNVAPGQELMKVINLDDVWITANFKETQLARDEGGPARHHRSRCERKKYNGKVDSIRRRQRRALQPAASGERHRKLRESGAAHSGEDRARSRANNDHQLRPGMSVTPKVWIRE